MDAQCEGKCLAEAAVQGKGLTDAKCQGKRDPDEAEVRHQQQSGHSGSIQTRLSDTVRFSKEYQTRS